MSFSFSLPLSSFPLLLSTSSRLPCGTLLWIEHGLLSLRSAHPPFVHLQETLGPPLTVQLKPKRSHPPHPVPTPNLWAVNSMATVSCIFHTCPDPITSHHRPHPSVKTLSLIHHLGDRDALSWSIASACALPAGILDPWARKLFLRYK